MKQMMCSLSQRLLQILTVERLDIRILVGESDGGLGIQCPQHIPARRGHLPIVVNRLAAAAGAAARAGHHLHEIVIRLAGIHRLHQGTGITQSADHSYPHLSGAWNGKGRLFPRLVAADLGKGVGIRVLAGNQIVGAAQSSIHNAAGGTEDHCRPSSSTQGAVKLRLFQISRNQTVAAEQAVHFAGGQNHVHIGIPAGVPHSRQFALRFFGRAGHDGDYKDLVGIYAYLLRKVALGHGAEHLLG